MLASLVSTLLLFCLYEKLLAMSLAANLINISISSQYYSLFEMISYKHTYVCGIKVTCFFFRKKDFHISKIHSLSFFVLNDLLFAKLFIYITYVLESFMVTLCFILDKRSCLPFNKVRYANCFMYLTEHCLCTSLLTFYWFAQAILCYEDLCIILYSLLCYKW